MRTSAAALAGALAAAVLLAAPPLARAGDNDLLLGRLGRDVPDDVIPNNQAFRSLSSELGVVIAPRFLSPADTLGFAGFQFTTDLAYTSISGSSPFWCATQETSASCSGDPGKSGGMVTSGFFVRKGIWLPLPSFELGAGAVHVHESEMWAGQAYAKFALHEGFHKWPLPSLAARGAVSRLFGSEQLDLTVASVDGSISKSIGIAGTVNLEPYLGWNHLWIVPRSEVIDKTPNQDALAEPQDIAKNFVFPVQDDITRDRLFGGFKLKYYIVTFTAELSYALAGSSLDDRTGTTRCDDPGAPVDACDAEDQAAGQTSFAFSLGLDF